MVFFYLESTCACVLGLEHSCLWPRIFFVSLASSLVSSTPPLLVTAQPRLRPAQRRAPTTPTSWRARHCNVRVKRTRSNSVDRLGRTTDRTILRVDLLIHVFNCTFTCGYVEADVTLLLSYSLSPSLPYKHSQKQSKTLCEWKKKCRRAIFHFAIEFLVSLAHACFTITIVHDIFIFTRKCLFVR